MPLAAPVNGGSVAVYGGSHAVISVGVFPLMAVVLSCKVVLVPFVNRVNLAVSTCDPRLCDGDSRHLQRHHGMHVAIASE
eukprot:447623-Rhodomonas_salina.3